MNALQTQIDSHFFPPCSTPYNHHESLLSAYQNCSSHFIIHSTAASLQIQTMALITSRYAPAHISPKGPGDARPTALQVIKDEGLLDGLPGKTVLVTGANGTTGLETARALHMTGARVFITTRTVEKNTTAVQSIVDSNGGEKGGLRRLLWSLEISLL
jgi:NADPH:quinone reductase-like Zn-dependent oxidoreductase